MFPKPDPRPDPSDPPSNVPPGDVPPSPVPPLSNDDQSDRKKWTLMFYFASDNSLASAIVSQLKAIKDAGFHKDVNVIARYDPHDGTTPAHIFDVNVGEKILSNKKHHIGFDAADPYVRTMVGDKLWSDEEDGKGNKIRQRIVDRFAGLGTFASGEPKYVYNPPEPKPPKPPFIPDWVPFREPSPRSEAVGGSGKTKTKPPKREPSPLASLLGFLGFCAENYRAEHYMLFILGHGIVVGNDLFLYDANTDKDHAVTLEDLGKALQRFTNEVKTKLDLVSFHSCSMSSLEVAYELRNTANYMLASEGPAFVGSWPYRPILLRVFNDVKDHGDKVDVATMLRRIFYYCFYNSYDFQLAGYSFDLCLTDLNRIGDPTENGIKAALEKLSEALIAGLKDRQSVGVLEHDSKAAALADLARDLIVWSHWQAQSYYEENFTDLGDFCFCLKRRCENAAQLFSNKLPPSIDNIRQACDGVLRALGRDKHPRSTEPITEERHADETDASDDHGVIVKSGFAGPGYQYSHGLSIYFPWSRPVDNKMWDEHYASYELSKETAFPWKKFLEEYFNTTRRDPQAKERKDASLDVLRLNEDAQLLEYIGGLIFNEAGQLKSSPYDKTGEDCVCPSIKNYPRITSEDGLTRNPDEQAPTLSADVLQRFRIFQGD